MANNMSKPDQRAKRVFVSRIDLQRSLYDQVADALAWMQWQSIVPSQARVFIKPNLTYPFYKPGVTTSPQLIEALISVLSDQTLSITIGESDGGSHAWEAEEAFEGHRLYEIADRYGATVVNLSKVEREYAGIQVNSRIVRVQLPSLLLHEVDVFITVPVPKVHAMTGVSLAFKNQWGCIPDTMRLRHHHQFNEMVVAINKLLNPKIVIFDGTYFLDRTGPMDGDPVRMDLIIAANDIGAGDLVCCEIMNIDPNKVKHFRLARKEGMFPSSLEEIYLNDRIENFNGRRFHLERTLMHWITLAAFNSRWGTKLVYDSPLAGPLHHVLYAIRGRPNFKAGY
jgi:uncharacterized protein (DUF362 family)